MALSLTDSSNRCSTFLSTHTVYVHIGIILLLGITSYANSLDVPLQFDDESTVRIINNLNSDVHSLKGFFRNDRWFVDITFSLNRQLHGERVLGYHLLNLSIHLLAACVIYFFAQQTIEALRRIFHIPGDDGRLSFLQCFIPLSTAALFVCHPVQTQAVTYISQRYTSLATLLYAASLLSYLKARLSSADESKKQHMWSWGVAALVLAILAMKSKPIALTLPIMAIMIEIVIFNGRLLKSRLFLTLGIGLVLVIPLQILYTYGSGSLEALFYKIQRATAETPLISRSDYLLTQFRVVVTYLRLLILPVNQNLDYDYPLYHSLLDPSVLSALLLHITLAGLAVVFFFRSKRQLASGDPVAGIPLRIACLGIFWFYLALSVESSVIPINDVIFEHRIYLPSVGFFIATTACCAAIASQRQRYRTAAWAAAVLLCLALTAATIARNRIWSSEMALWQDTFKNSPNKARVRHCLGTLYLRRILPENALPHLVRAVELDPNNRNYWITLNSIITVLSQYNGRGSEGIEFHTTIGRIDPKHSNEWWALSYNNLGLAYEHLRNRVLARESYQKAVTINPALDFAWYNLALLAASRNDAASVETSLERLRAINPLMGQDAAKTIRDQRHAVQLKAQ